MTQLPTSDPAPLSPAQSNAGRDYRFQRFHTGLLLDDLPFGRDAPGAGDPVPAFDRPALDGGRLRRQDPGRLPVLLVLGSRTCPRIWAPVIVVGRSWSLLPLTHLFE